MSTLVLDAPTTARPKPPGDATIIQDYLFAAAELLARDDLRVTTETDMAGWVSIVSSAPRSAGVNPTFNPAMTDHADAYWLHVTHGQRTAAVIAARFIECSGYYDFIRAGALWSRDPSARVDILIDEPGPAGRLAHTGGLWVDPDYRGIGLSWLMPRFNHCFATLRWDLASITAMVFEGLKKTGIPEKNYGSEISRLMIDGHFEPTGRPERITSLEYSRDFIIDRARNDAQLIGNDGDQQMRDLAPIASQRNDQAAVHRRDVA